MLETVAAAVAAFTLVIGGLTVLLLVAHRRLSPSGQARVVVNDDREHALTLRLGQSLLEGLGEHGVFLPSACGGQGTCGACRVTVTEGGGGLLPTEEAKLTPAQARAHQRLACQLRLRGDLGIELPPALFAASRFTCRVRSTRFVATFIKELVLELPPGHDLDFRAGGYIQLHCPPHTLSYRDFDVPAEFRPDWERQGLFRHVSRVREATSRAYSMANYPGEPGIVMLDVRITPPPPSAPDAPPGIVSSYIFGLREGDEVTVSGPFGEFYAREGDREMVFVGGGSGMAPMRSHILDQLLRLHATRKISFWYGARSLREAFYREEFERLAAEHDNFEFCLALSEPLPEDDWHGATGFIHQVLRDHYLARHPAPEDVEYYLCGPPPMLKAVRELLDGLGVDPGDVLFDDFG